MIDLYCERTGPGLWAEPVNTTANLAYLLAAWGVWRAGGSSPRAPVRTLAGLIAAIAAGSALFHLLATPGARLLDEAPILAFQLTYLWAYARRVAGLKRASAMVLTGAFLLLVLGGRRAGDVLNGSLPYLPAVLGTVAFGVYHARTGRRERFALLTGAGLLAAAVVFRTTDEALCAAFPIGTHFLWHLLTAVVLYVLARALLVNWPSRGSTRTG